jgi:hypothetical protein
MFCHLYVTNDFMGVLVAKWEFIEGRKTDIYVDCWAVASF